jgi:Cu/Ag efflux protein CusF
VAAHESPRTPSCTTAHSHVRGTAIVNAVDPTAHKVKLTHSPIAEIGWPAMTMEFLVAPS